jgi:hypothetical protein
VFAFNDRSSLSTHIWNKNVESITNHNRRFSQILFTRRLIPLNRIVNSLQPFPTTGLFHISLKFTGTPKRLALILLLILERDIHPTSKMGQLMKRMVIALLVFSMGLALESEGMVR